MPLRFLLLLVIAIHLAAGEALPVGLWQIQDAAPAHLRFSADGRFVQGTPERIAAVNPVTRQADRIEISGYGDTTVFTLRQVGADHIELVPSSGATLKLVRAADAPDVLNPGPYAAPAAAPDAAAWKAFAKAIGQRFRRDQDTRRAFEKASGGKMDAATLQQPAVAKALADMQAIDTDNSRWFSAQVQALGWPTRAAAGADAAHKALFLALHSDDLRVLASAAAGLASVRNAGGGREREYGMVADRLRLHRNEALLYGIQAGAGADGVPMVPIADRAAVDIRRKRIGEPPLAEMERRGYRIIAAPPAPEDAAPAP